MLGAGIDVFSAEKTRASIQEMIIDWRKSQDLTEREARDEWNLCKSIEDEWSFGDWLRETELHDAWDWARSTEMDYSWRNFWDRLWTPLIVPELRRLAEKAA